MAVAPAMATGVDSPAGREQLNEFFEFVLRTAPLVLLTVTAGSRRSTCLRHCSLSLQQRPARLSSAPCGSRRFYIRLPNGLMLLSAIPLLVATRLRVMPSLLNRNDWRWWTPAIAALSIGGVLCWSTVYAYRTRGFDNASIIARGNLPTNEWNEDAARIIESSCRNHVSQHTSRDIWKAQRRYEYGRGFPSRGLSTAETTPSTNAIRTSNIGSRLTRTC